MVLPIALLGLMGWILWALWNKKHWLFSVMPITVCLNAIGFYISYLVIYNGFPYDVDNLVGSFRLWSGTLIVHAMISHVILAGAFIALNSKWEEK